ncbi:MAG: penicillin-binding protein 2, partial [Deltaproteobacteria bacterium]
MARVRGTRASEDAAHRVALAWMRVRVAVVGGLLGAGLLVLLGRAVDLQVVQHDRLAQMARDQTLRKVEVQAPRARIEDRNGEALALSVDVDSVAVDPSRLKDRSATARALASILEVDARTLEARLARGRYFTWVRRRVSPAQAEAVRGLGLPGVFLVREARRFYPHRELAAQVLGFVGIDGNGLEGLELSLDSVLRGERTSALALRDAHGRRLLQDDPFGEPEVGPGKVRLTLDRTIQWITERALLRAVRSSRARAGMAVVLEPTTGAVLALASVPTYNPNRPGDAERRARRNRPLTDVYEPGSTFKVFTLGAALEAGQVTPDTPIECEGGAWKVAGRVIHDSHPHTRLTVTEVLTKSSNIGAAKIAAALGRDRLADTLEAAGFGHRTGLRLPGEQSGILHRRDRIGPVELATLAFGQGIAVTPIQLASAISAVANGGVRMKPYLVARIEHPDGSVEVTRPRVAGRVFSARTAAMLTRMMETVTRPG